MSKTNFLKVFPISVHQVDSCILKGRGKGEEYCLRERPGIGGGAEAEEQSRSLHSRA